jgi:hypothetical protein
MFARLTLATMLVLSACAKEKKEEPATPKEGETEGTSKQPDPRTPQPEPLTVEEVKDYFPKLAGARVLKEPSQVRTEIVQGAWCFDQGEAVAIADGIKTELEGLGWQSVTVRNNSRPPGGAPPAPGQPRPAQPGRPAQPTGPAKMGAPPPEAARPAQPQPPAAGGPAQPGQPGVAVRPQPGERLGITAQRPGNIMLFGSVQRGAWAECSADKGQTYVNLNIRRNTGPRPGGVGPARPGGNMRGPVQIQPGGRPQPMPVQPGQPKPQPVQPAQPTPAPTE